MYRKFTTYEILRHSQVNLNEKCEVKRSTRYNNLLICHRSLFYTSSKVIGHEIEYNSTVDRTLIRLYIIGIHSHYSNSNFDKSKSIINLMIDII